MIRPGVIEEAVRLLVDAAHPQKIVLFGSAARGDVHEFSDLDFMVVLKEVDGHFDEIVKLHQALAPLGEAVDVLVYSEQEIEEWGHLAGLAMHEALVEGRVVYEAA